MYTCICVNKHYHNVQQCHSTCRQAGCCSFPVHFILYTLSHIHFPCNSLPFYSLHSLLQCTCTPSFPSFTCVSSTPCLSVYMCVHLCGYMHVTMYSLSGSLADQAVSLPYYNVRTCTPSFPSSTCISSTCFIYSLSVSIYMYSVYTCDCLSERMCDNVVMCICSTM